MQRAPKQPDWEPKPGSFRCGGPDRVRNNQRPSAQRAMSFTLSPGFLFAGVPSQLSGQAQKAFGTLAPPGLSGKS